MTKLNQESGRSMVEMLGVLAIIGVLSIGGIAGYTMAMNRYRANEVLSIAGQLTVLAQAKKQGAGDTASLTDLNLTASNVAGLASSGKIDVDATGTVPVVTIESLSSDAVGSAIESIAGGTTGSCKASKCTLKMEGGRLTVS